MPQKIKGDNQCAIAEKPLSNFSMTKGSDGTPRLDGANLMQPMPKAP